MQNKPSRSRTPHAARSQPLLSKQPSTLSTAEFKTRQYSTIVQRQCSLKGPCTYDDVSAFQGVIEFCWPNFVPDTALAATSSTLRGTQSVAKVVRPHTLSSSGYKSVPPQLRGRGPTTAAQLHFPGATDPPLSVLVSEPHEMILCARERETQWLKVRGLGGSAPPAPI